VGKGLAKDSLKNSGFLVLGQHDQSVILSCELLIDDCCNLVPVSTCKAGANKGVADPFAGEVFL